MKEINFLPLWYRNKIKKKNKIKYKVVIFLMMLLIGVSSIKFINCRNCCKNINDKINHANSDLKKHESKKLKNKSTRVYGAETYLKLNKELFNKVKFNEICINNNVISIEGIFQNMDSATDAINCIEIQKYIINNIDVENLEENKILLKMNFKVGKNE